MLFSAGCIITQASLTLNAQVRDHVLGDSPCQNASKCTAHLYMKESSADKDRWLQMLPFTVQPVRQEANCRYVSGSELPWYTLTLMYLRLLCVKVESFRDNGFTKHANNVIVPSLFFLLGRCRDHKYSVGAVDQSTRIHFVVSQYDLLFLLHNSKINKNSS